MNRKVLSAAGVILLALGVLGVIPSSGGISTGQAVAGEAGIIDGQGNRIPLTILPAYSVYTVNQHSVGLDDLIYTQAWLLVKASADGRLKSVHFTVTQQSPLDTGYWATGTDNVPDGMPKTSPTESWFDVALPKDVETKVILKYRDNLWSGKGETSTNLFGDATWDPAAQTAIRNKHLWFCRVFEELPDGTYTFKTTFTLVSISWQPTSGSEITVTNINPNTYSKTFTIVKSAPTLTVYVSGATSLTLLPFSLEYQGINCAWILLAVGLTCIYVGYSKKKLKP